MRGDLRPVIVGYGRAGRDLHHRALGPLLDPEDAVLVVDPRPAALLPGGRWAPTAADAVRSLEREGVPVGQAVFHVTTPPEAHLACVEELAALGVRRVILEKPIATGSAEARRIAHLAAGITVLPVSVWLSSRITAAVEDLIARGEIGDPTALHFEQSKPRFRRTLQSGAHQSAFQVEMPHQALLALHLAGACTRVAASTTWPMSLPDRELPAMGGALLILDHESGMTSTLLTDLTSPVRRRRLRVTGTRGEIIADYPISADDDFGQVRVSGRPGRLILRDEPLSQFIDAAYAAFRGESPPPQGDLDLHVHTIELLERAAASAVPAPAETTEFASWRG